MLAHQPVYHYFVSPGHFQFHFDCLLVVFIDIFPLILNSTFNISTLVLSNQGHVSHEYIYIYLFFPISFGIDNIWNPISESTRTNTGKVSTLRLQISFFCPYYLAVSTKSCCVCIWSRQPAWRPENGAEQPLCEGFTVPSLFVRRRLLPVCCGCYWNQTHNTASVFYRAPSLTGLHSRVTDWLATAALNSDHSLSLREGSFDFHVEVAPLI